MDLDKIFIKNACPTKIGGQAVIEGVMMKGPSVMATSVRKPDGDITIKIDDIKAPGKISKMPIIRGVYAFGSSMITGIKTLMYSAEVLEEAGMDIEKGKLDLWIEKKFGDNATNVLLYFSLVTAIVFSVGIFIILPTVAINFVKYFTTNVLMLNLLEGLLRIVMFIIYVFLISRLEDIKRVFQYHGAEHKSIHCFENGLDLTVENCKTFSTIHPRCGTSFMMFVLVISLLLFSFLGWPNLIIRILSRLLFIPIIAGLSYELLRWAGKSSSGIVKIISYPGLLLQKLTTKEPDDMQMEVALTSLKAVLDHGKGNNIDGSEN